MKKIINLLPADTYTVINQTILTEIDKKILINLYEPIIGPNAISLYLTLWSDLDKLELMSKDYTHHHLMTILKSSLETIGEARRSLEAVGLLKSFVKESDNVNEYLYELYSPLSAYEFFNHPVLNVLLLNNLGELEYNNIKNYYKKINIRKDEFTEITSSMNDIYKVVTPYEATNEEIRKQNSLGLNIDNILEFDLIEASIPKDLITSRTLNKKTKELLNQLAFVYNIDTLKMIELIRLSINDIGVIDKEKIRLNARKNYEYNNNGSLPTIVYRSQPEHLKTPTGDLSNRGKMIQVFENTKPYDFLRSRNRNHKPTTRELKTIEHLAIDFELPPGVINVLVDYVLRVNEGRFVPAYIEEIASTWSRNNIKTVPEAMDQATKSYKKATKQVKTIKPNVVVPTPAWMKENITKEEMTKEELEELENMFQEYRR